MKKLSRNLDEAIDTINEDVKDLLKYGQRKATPTGPSYVIAWSNQQMKWWMLNGRILPRHGDIHLDANQLLIGGFTEITIKAALPQLLRHPLYRNSYEFREKQRIKEEA